MNRGKSLISLFGIGVLFVGCSGQQSPREAVASVSSANYLSVIPENANILVYANLAELRATPFSKEIRKEFEKRVYYHDDHENYLDFVEKTGLDVERDIHELWVAGEAEQADDRDQNTGGAIVRGNFDQDRITDYLKRKSRRKAREERYEGYDLYVVTGRHDDEFAYAFLNSETMLLGGPAWLKDVIDLSENGGDNILDNPSMSQHIRDIPNRQHLWGVLDVHNLTNTWANEIRRRGSGFRGTESLQNMQSVKFYARVDQRADLFVEGTCRRDEEAELLAETLNGFKAMAKLLVSDDRDAIDMLNDIKVKSRGSVLNISARLEQDFFEKLEQKRQKLGGRNFDFP